LAAANRFRYVVENYQTTARAPEALHRLVESYLKLGVYEEAKRYAAVLGYNYPGSLWYRDSYALMTEKGMPPATEPGEGGEASAVPPPAEDSSSMWDSILP